MALIDALRMIAEPLKHLIDRVGRRVDGVERDIADVGNKVDFIHTTAPIVQTASVGQTVVVKAVDESGKPTEWEAKDMSGSAGGDSVVVVANCQITGMNGTTATGTCDLNANEIKALMDGGKVVYLYFDGMGQIAVTNWVTNEVGFYGMRGEQLGAYYDSDNTLLLVDTKFTVTTNGSVKIEGYRGRVNYTPQ